MLWPVSFKLWKGHQNHQTEIRDCLLDLYFEERKMCFFLNNCLKYCMGLTQSKCGFSETQIQWDLSYFTCQSWIRSMWWFVVQEPLKLTCLQSRDQNCDPSSPLGVPLWESALGTLRPIQGFPAPEANVFSGSKRELNGSHAFPMPKWSECPPRGWGQQLWTGLCKRRFL